MADGDNLTGLSLTIPLTKIDVERRLVIGRAAQEIVDKTGEIMDYETSRPAFEQWSLGQFEASGGLSKGNLRVMHSRVAAGLVQDMTFDDDAKAVDIVAHVVDPIEWEKCLKGVYTGFSIGGGYARKWKDGNLTRYTPRIAEISLVDSPCMPTARFAELVKMDAVVGQVELLGAPPRSFAALLAERDQAQAMTFGALRKRAAEGNGAGQALTFADLRKRASGGAGVVAAVLPRGLFFGRDDGG